MHLLLHSNKLLHGTRRVSLAKATKPKANPVGFGLVTLQLIRFAWRPETMILPGHKVAITVARLLTDSKAITKSKDTHYLWKNKVEVTSHNAVLHIVDVQV